MDERRILELKRYIQALRSELYEMEDKIYDSRREMDSYIRELNSMGIDEDFEMVDYYTCSEDEDECENENK